MTLTVREMMGSEVGLIIDYFFQSTPEYLEILGVDPTRLPAPKAWRERFRRDWAHCRSTSARCRHLAVGRPAGRLFDRRQDRLRRTGQHAPARHRPRAPESGFGVECVRRSVGIYFERLKLKRLFCEPNAFNVAPNRTLQKAGFKYLKTHMTVPGPLNYHQAVTRWVIER
jgi:hypothetical protein